MNSVYEIIGESKVHEICELYGLSHKDRVTLGDLFTRFDEVEKFLETDDENRVLEAQTDVAENVLKENPHSCALLYAITSICNEFRLIKNTVYQLRDLYQEGVLLH